MIRWLAIFTLPVLMAGCFGDNETPLEVSVDAWVVKKTEGEQPVYGVAFYAYGNKVMKSGTVTRQGGLGNFVHLGLNPGSIFTLYKEPADEDFNPVIPESANYLFSVTAESGESFEGSDQLNPKNIGIPVILKTELDDVQKILKVTWMKITAANGYVVKIANADGIVIYSSGAVDKEVTTLNINLLTGYWTAPMEQGNTYTVEVDAFTYENTATEYDAAFNLEEISMDTQTITWE